MREARFEDRSLFPVAAACLVANGVRDSLSGLLRASVDLRLLPPAIPAPAAWTAIASGATIFHLGGARLDVALIFGPAAATAITAAAFGEVSSPQARTLSKLEDRVLERVARGLVPSLAGICGPDVHGARLERLDALRGYATFFELAVEQPFRARIGVALSRDQQPECVPALDLEDLGDVELELRVTTDGVLLPASGLAAIEIGAIMPITGRAGLSGVVSVAGRRIAGGECGVRGNRLAMAIGLTPCTEGSSEPDHDR
ncbi:MAG TPA: hypothetical protein VFN49_00550 [Candidatus Aquilonibacter sp.]|nr:hypothetical protein [Candidatus Aquilonibacter sp.]